MIIQTEFFDSPGGGKERDEAMARAYDNANQEWREAAMFAVLNTAKHMQEFTADDIWFYMPPGIITHDNRALGPVMRLAMKIGMITTTDQFKLSNRPNLHKCPRRIWRSNIFGREEDK